MSRVTKEEFIKAVENLDDDVLIDVCAGTLNTDYEFSFEVKVIPMRKNDDEQYSYSHINYHQTEVPVCTSLVDMMRLTGCL